MKLYKHQQDIIDENRLKTGLFLGTGSGKSATALMLAEGKTLVVCPKILREDKTWQKNLEKINKKLDLTVVSKEDFRRDWEGYGYYDTIIFDECHQISGVTSAIKWVKKVAYPKASQLFEAALAYLEKHPPKRLYLLTATPTRSAMCVYGLGRLLGRDWDFYKFRSIYYTPVMMNFREIWIPKKDKETQDRLGLCVRGLGYTGQLSDWMDVPEQTHKVINIELTKEQKDKIKDLPLEFPDPLVLIGKKHQVEQGVLKGNEFEPSQTFKTGKLEAIEDLYNEFGKVLVFAKYTEQIEQIKLHFKDYLVFSITGDTKDRGSVIQAAEQYTNCIMVIQSTISAGYELPSFRCTIFASESYSIVDNIQSIGRTLRANNLQKNLYIYLVSGEIDKAVRKAIELKGDFSEAIYSKLI